VVAEELVHRVLPEHHLLVKAYHLLELQVDQPEESEAVQEGLDEVLKLDLPTIISPVITNFMKGFPNLVTDCSAIAKLGADYLLKLGFRQFAFCGFPNMPWSEDRSRIFTAQSSFIS